MKKIKLPEQYDNAVGCVMALGCFDGVHTAHVSLIAHAVEEAKRRSLSSAVWALSIERDDLLSVDEEKTELIAACKPDMIVLDDYDAVKNMSCREFISMLKEDFGAEELVCGYNFTFGKGREGNAENIAEIAGDLGLSAYVMPCIKQNGFDVSSSIIRSCLRSGDIEKANTLLGRPFTITGRVTKGLSNGRRFGYPTVNIPAQKGLIMPKNGVYKSRTAVGDKEYLSVTDIGTRPTLNGDELRSETHLLDFCGASLYGMEISVSLLSYLRPECRFESENELVNAIRHDVEKVMATEKAENGDDCT